MGIAMNVPQTRANVETAEQLRFLHKVFMRCEIFVVEGATILCGKRICSIFLFF